MKSHLHSFVCLLSLVWITSCRAIKPEAPSTDIAEIPSVAPMNSKIFVPVQVDLTSYFQMAEKTIPAEVTGAENPCEGLRYSYLFQRGPLTFTGNQQTMNLSLNGKYRVSGSYCAKCAFDNCLLKTPTFSCGVNEPMRGISIGFSSAVKINSDYSLQTNTILSEATSLDPCKISFLKIDVTDRLMTEIRKSLQQLAIQTDQQTATYPFRKQIQELWNTLWTEVPAGKQGYFNLQPQGLSLTNLTFKGHLLEVNLGIVCQPKFTIQSSKQPASPLPNMKPLAGNDGFSVVLDANLPYTDLSDMISAKMGDTNFVIKGKSFHIDKIELMAAGKHKISARIQFSGNKKGTVYLTGTPVVDSMTQTFSVPDLSFDIKTKNVLLKTASWLLDGKIERSLRANMRYPLASILKETKQEVTQSLNRTLESGMIMTGTVLSLKVKDIYPLKDMLLVRIQSAGTINVQMK